MRLMTAQLVLAAVTVALVAAAPQFTSTLIEQCPSANDVVFVLDESGSIYPRDFQMQLGFVNDFINSFNTDFNFTHVGIMTFADSPKSHMQLNDFHDQARMNARVLGIPQRRGQTMTHTALDYMRARMFSPSNTRSYVPHVAIVVTDGNPDSEDLTAAAAARAHAANIIVIAIGVGYHIDEDVLDSIASSPDLVFSISNYAGLDDIVINLADTTCEVTTLPPPTTTTEAPTTTTLPLIMSGCRGTTSLDVAFALPDAADIVDTEYILEFVDNIVAEFEMSRREVQVSLTPRVGISDGGIQLKEFDSSEGFSDALFERRRQHGTPTDNHLNHLITDTFGPARGGREGATKIAIIVMNNQPEEEVDGPVAAAQEMGIHLLVVGVGHEVDENELALIASTPDDVYTVSSYAELDSLQPAIMERLCQVGLGHSEHDTDDD